MAKNLLEIIPKLTEDELELLCRKMGNIDVQELSFCNRFDVARSLGRYYVQLATKIWPYWPLFVFAKHLMRLSQLLTIGILILTAIVVPGFAIVVFAMYFGSWWLFLFIPFFVLLVAAIFTVIDYYDPTLR